MGQSVSDPSKTIVFTTNKFRAFPLRRPASSHRNPNTLQPRHTRRTPSRRRRGRRERCWRRPFGVSFCCASAPSRRPRCASPRAFCPTLAGRTAGRLAQDLAGPFRSPWDVLRPRNALQRRPVGRASGTRAASEIREMTFCTSNPRLAAAATVGLVCDILVGKYSFGYLPNCMVLYLPNRI